MPAVFHKQRDSSIAKVVISGIPDQNDLISSLANELREISSDRAQPEVIVHASEVVAFQLIHTSSASDRQKFRFPAYFYLDQFMADKAALAHEKRQVQHRLLEDVVTLEAKKKVLTKFQVRRSPLNVRGAVTDRLHRIAMSSPICNPLPTIMKV